MRVTVWLKFFTQLRTAPSPLNITSLLAEQNRNEPRITPPVPRTTPL